MAPLPRRILRAAVQFPKDKPELVEVVRRTLTDEDIEILENVLVHSISHGADNHTVTIGAEADGREIKASHILVAAGRKANIEG